MKKLINFVLMVVAFLIATSVGIFAIGSMIGNHSIQYDDNGTWMCWTPYNRAMQDCWQIAAWVPSAYVIEHKQGFVGCKDGMFTIANITFSGMVRKDTVDLIDPKNFECTR